MIKPSAALLLTALVSSGVSAEVPPAESNTRVVVLPHDRMVTLYLRAYGTRSEGGRESKIYFVSIGDVTRDDRIAAERSDAGLFAFDAAQYFHRVDGSWFMWNWHFPREVQREWDWFYAYLRRPDVGAFTKDPFGAGEFGTPCSDWAADRGKTCDFIYKRIPIKTTELPAQLANLSGETLDEILSVFEFNEDGAIKIFLRDDFEADGPAQKFFDRFADELAGIR